MMEKQKRSSHRKELNWILTRSNTRNNHKDSHKEAQHRKIFKNNHIGDQKKGTQSNNHLNQSQGTITQEDIKEDPKDAK